MTFKLFSTCLVFAAAFVSCKHEMVEPGTSTDATVLTSTDSVSFQTQILPLYQSYCGSKGCHDATSAKEGVITTNYFDIMKGIRSKNPGGSKYLTIIKNGEMPPRRSARLNNAQIALIEKWINEGAKNTIYYSTNCDTALITYTTGIQTIFQNNCTGCHNSNNASGGVQLATYTDIYNYLKNNQNTFSNSINYTSTAASSNMPPSGKMNSCNIASINKWITNGIPQ